MPLLEKLSEKELALLEILRHPVWCGEFIRSFDLDEEDEEWEYTDYQKEFLCDFNKYVSMCCARAVGKCFSGNARILNPKTGEYKTIKEWGNSLDTIVSINKEWKQEISKPIFIENGEQPVLKIFLKKGFTTEVTYNHPFLTNTGWVNAEDLKEGDLIAVPKELPYFGEYSLPEEDLRILGLFISEGTYKTGSITTSEEKLKEYIYEYAQAKGMEVREEILDNNQANMYFLTTRDYKKGAYYKLLEEFNLRYKHSYDKHIPRELFKLKKKDLALFLSTLFDGDGWACDTEIGYCSSSELLIRDLHHLLLRFGIVCSYSFSDNGYHGKHSLSIKGYKNVKNFVENINFSIKRKKQSAEKLMSSSENKANQADVLPLSNYSDYYYLDSNSCNGTPRKRKLRYYPTFYTAKKVENKDDLFEKFESANIRWVPVKRIKPIGTKTTYGYEVNPNNTHVVDDIYSHNTVSLIDRLVWYTLNTFWDETIVYTVPSRVHLEPVFLRLRRWYRTHSLLQHYTGRTGINSQSFTIKLHNGAVIDCRIAGQSGTGANVVGLHVPIILLDEAGFYPYGTFTELMPCLNEWQEGSQLIVSGVPTGLRENNVLYYADQKDEKYTKHRISAFDNPRYTEEMDARNLKQYGGKDSEDYVHLILGEHGIPSYAMFDRERMLIGNYDVFTGSAYGQKLNKDPSYLLRLFNALPKKPRNISELIFGIDLGYTDPTIILIWYRYKRSDSWKYLARIRLNSVDYHKQEGIIDKLDSHYSPDMLAIDAGHSGKAVVQHLRNDPKYSHKHYQERVVPIEFRSSIPVGIDEEGKEVEVRAKQFGMELLQSKLNNHRYKLTWKDESLINELERTTYRRTPSGELVFRTTTPRGGIRKGEDHNLSAFLCAVIGYYLKFELNSFEWQQRPELYKPRWGIL